MVARTEPGVYVWRMVTGGEGYLGMSSLPVEIGLGESPSADLEITWPGGDRQILSGVLANRMVRVRQGIDTVETVFASDGSPAAETAR